ncbi:hypothetical protein [Williamsia sp. CHRR-6]|uniref:hypothetical protein n=1 Tax=Williamsia sp. CHRR-6 TaxID=2835871 RepID=UPI001BDA402F|nr:hypothetical protein [Williamsia sp. CHRR-6]MBT0566132.1 hypothetical protein [Williamsia sp. CHRR-6]
MPITATSVHPLSLTIDALERAGSDVVLVDVRTHAQRAAGGVIAGALAIDPDLVLDRLTPGGPAALCSATAETRWVLLSADGIDAEWWVWHLHARGVTGARYLLGGVAGLASRRPAAWTATARRDLATIAAH